ncbi:hypothetical protein Hanom_Chr00s089617g01798341 [Helianthus anomalus]
MYLHLLGCCELGYEVWMEFMELYQIHLESNSSIEPPFNLEGMDGALIEPPPPPLSHPNQWRKHRDETKCEDCSRHHNANNCDKYLNNPISFHKKNCQHYKGFKYNKFNKKKHNNITKLIQHIKP